MKFIRLIRPFRLLIALLPALILLLVSACKKDDDTEPVAVLTPGFTANSTSIKARQSVQFTNQSTFSGSGSVTLAWTFQGGEPAASTASNPTVKYNKPGKYTVTLTATAGGLTRTVEKTQYIDVDYADPQIATSNNLPANIKGRLAANPNNVRFVRFALKPDGNDVHVVARNGGGWQAQAWTGMIDQLEAHHTTLEGGTWIGPNGEWLVVYSKNYFASNGLSADALQALHDAHNAGSTIIRFDVDSEGGYALRTTTSYRLHTYTDLYFELGGAISFAFGTDKKWAVVYPHDYAVSANCPQSLKDSLAGLKAQGFEFLDIEIGASSWVVVYR